MNGVWKITYSMQASVNSGELKRAGLYLNGSLMEDTIYLVYSTDGEVRSTGGREWTVWVGAGETISLGVLDGNGFFSYINFCATFIPTI